MRKKSHKLTWIFYDGHTVQPPVSFVFWAHQFFSNRQSLGKNNFSPGQRLFSGCGLSFGDAVEKARFAL